MYAQIIDDQKEITLVLEAFPQAAEHAAELVAHRGAQEEAAHHQGRDPRRAQLAHQREAHGA